MPQNDLSPARLRALIAAATPGPWDRPTDEGNHLAICIDHPETGHQCIADFPYRNINHEEDAQLVRCLVNNAPALPDALEAKELLEWALAHCYIAAPTAWDEKGNQIDAAEVDTLDALRAAKEVADGKI